MRGDSHVVTLVPMQCEIDGPAMQEEQVTIEVQGTSPPEIGEPLAIRVRHDLLNLFDRQTGRTSRRSRRRGAVRWPKVKH